MCVHATELAKGPHVQKIQLALVILDSADLPTDGAYGPKTAAAVLAFKKKRQIVNTTYQKTVDNVVGKMTVSAMDRELLSRELVPPPRAHVEAISPRSPATITTGQPVRVGLIESRIAARGAKSDGNGFDLPLLSIGPRFSTHFMELSVGASGVFRVENAKGGIVSISDTRLAHVVDPNLQNAHGNFIGVYRDSLELRVTAVHPGSCQINVTFPASAQKGPFAFSQGLHLKIRFLSDLKDFTPGVNHNHLPCKDWNKVKAHPNSGVKNSDTPEGGDGLVSLIGAPVIGQIVRNSSSPRDVVDKVLKFPFGPLARAHLNFYLKEGGRDFVEDDNIRRWLNTDDGIRKRLSRAIKAQSQRSNSKLIRGNFEFLQREYENDDFQGAFGSIDRVDYEADLVGGDLTVWFKDRYEWHPVYPGLYVAQSGDDIRPSNGIHAAMVEMKLEGAADFWMMGECTVAMV